MSQIFVVSAVNALLEVGVVELHRFLCPGSIEARAIQVALSCCVERVLDPANMK